jgi:hypothetical protein
MSRPSAERYVAPSGEEFVVYKPSLSVVFRYSPDGKQFYAAAGGIGSSRGHAWRGLCTVPALGIDLIAVSHGIVGDSTTLQVGGETYALTDGPGAFSEPTVVPLPIIRVTTYLARLSSGQLLYVDHTLYDFSYDTMRLYMGGDGVDMHQHTITKFERFKDGGTTHITAAIGQLKWPFVRRAVNVPVPTWNGAPITKLDASLYDIDTSGDDVRVTLR